MKKLFKSAKAKTAAVVGTLMTSGAANAAVDVSGAVGDFTTDVGAGIAAVGGAMIVASGIAVTYKWIKAAFFG